MIYDNENDYYDFEIDLDGNVCGIDKDGIVHDNDKFELMRYIELMDKNRKMIYEGDIVSIDGENLYVGLRDGVYLLLESSYNSPGCCFYVGKEINKFDEDDMEIVGNIYENPELLENKND